MNTPIHSQPRIAIIGGGAAGSFAAIEIKRRIPHAAVFLLERTETLLAKVRISGGGRCNATHACFDPKILSLNYPRGGSFLLPLFSRFQPQDTITWFEREGVFLHAEEDGRMFPTTNSSDTIIQLFFSLFRKLGISVLTGVRIRNLQNDASGITLQTEKEADSLGLFDAVVIATGSHPTPLSWLSSLGIEIIPQVPSLFTFNCPTSPLHDLAGVSVPTARITLTEISSQKRSKKPFYTEGPLLVTHWGFSGPAVLKLSAIYARELHACHYTTSFAIDWSPHTSFSELHEKVSYLRTHQGSKNILGTPVCTLPKSLYERLIALCELEGREPWATISKKNEEKLITMIKRSQYDMKGKTTYKNEFVTAGGVSLHEVHARTMALKKYPAIFLAGEVLDIDGVTGGFNFQAAWTTAWTAAQGIERYIAHRSLQEERASYMFDEIE